MPRTHAARVIIWYGVFSCQVCWRQSTLHVMQSTPLSQHNLPNLESASFWIHFIDDELVQFLQSRQIFGILGLPVLVNVGPCMHGLQILLHCHIFFLHTDSKYVSQ